MKTISMLVMCLCLLLIAPAAHAQGLTKRDEAFLTEVRQNWPILENGSSQVLIRTARIYCRTMDKGYEDWEIAHFISERDGTPWRRLFRYIRSSAKYYCPRHF